jgi:hypothetical protein
MTKHKIILLIAFLSLCNCQKIIDSNNIIANNTPKVDFEKVQSDTFHQVELNIDSIYLGWIFCGNQNLCPKSDTSYDTITNNILIDSFQISVAPINIKEFKLILSTLSFDSSINNLSDSSNVHHIRLEEAMIFCNELSKKDGLDTFYNFNVIGKTLGHYEISCNHCYNLRSNGYRLPTRIELDVASKDRIISQNELQYTLEEGYGPDTLIEGIMPKCTDHIIWGNQGYCLGGGWNLDPNAVFRIVKNNSFNSNNYLEPK